MLTKIEKAAYRKRQQAERQAEGLCKCGKKSRTGKKTCEGCAAYQKQYAQARKKKGVCASCGGKKAPDKTRCTSCLEKNRLYLTDLRAECIAAYGGPSCACCQEARTEFLQLDHINNDGGKHRKQIGTGVTFYLWLKRNKFPPGLQVLCANCNYSKAYYGFCPHHPEKVLCERTYRCVRGQGCPG